MDELEKIITERRSIRSFKDTPVPRELIDRIINAGLFAASGRGLQAPKIIAVTNKGLRDAVSDENRRIGGWSEGFDPFYGAPVILIVVADSTVPTAVYDGSLTMGNMMLMAHDLGLGSIWIHRAKEEFDSEFGKNLLRKAGIEGDFEGIAHLAVGYTKGDYPAVIPRNDGRVFYLD